MQEIVIGTPAERARRQMVVFILAGLSTFAPFATDMYLPSFPAIAASFGCSVGDVQLSLSTFFLGLALGQLFYGPLIDRFGRRIPLLCGIALFIGASIGLIHVQSISGFVALRFVQAVGGCAGMIVSRAIIQDLFGASEAARALSLLMVVQGVGPVVAPVLGGYVIALAGWHAVFVFLSGFGVMCLLAAWLVLPESLAPERRHGDSVVEICRSFTTMIGSAEFMIPCVASSLAVSMMFAFIAGSPFVLMNLFGVSAQTYGWLFGLNAAGMILASLANRMLLQRHAPRRLLGMAVWFAVVMSALAVPASQSHSLTVFMIPLVLCLAMVPVIGANGTAIAMAANSGRAGVASSLLGVLQFGLASLVSALVGVLNDGTAFPMLGIIFLCCGLSGGLIFWRRKNFS